MKKFLPILITLLLTACTAGNKVDPGLPELPAADDAATEAQEIPKTSPALDVIVFLQVSGMVNSAVFSPDGRYVLTGDESGEVKIWEADTGEHIRTFSGNTEILHDVSISPDGKYFVTGSNGKKVNIWNIETGILERSLKIPDSEVYAVAFSPDSRLVAAGGRLPKIRIWETETGNELKSLSGHYGSVYALKFNPEGRYLASASGDKTIIMWDLEAGSTVNMNLLYRHEAAVSSLTFSTDGNFLYSGSRDHMIVIWENIGREEYYMRNTFTGHRGAVNSVAVNSDDTWIVSGSGDGTVRRWIIDTGEDEILATDTAIRDIAMNGIRSVAISPDDSSIIASTDYGQIFMWETGSAWAIRYKGVKDRILGIINSLCYTSDGKRILAGFIDGTARLYNAEDLSEIACFVYISGKEAEPDALAQGVSQIDGEWFTITPDGYYQGSPGAGRFINVLIKDYGLYPMDKVSGFFNRPDVVRSRLAGNSDPEYMPSFAIQ